MIWLLDITWSGVVYRWSSVPWGAYPGGLSPVELDRTIDLAGTSPGQASASFELVWPVDVAELISEGHDLGGATAELSYLESATDAHEDRVIVIANARLEDPDYGSRYQAVALTVRANAYDDTETLWPPRAHEINATTWPTLAEAAAGEVYPQVYGTPGVYVSPDSDADLTSPGSPAHVIHTTNKWLLIAGHEGDAFSVTIHSVDDAGSGSPVEGSYTVSHRSDALGQVVAYVDLTTGAVTYDADGEYWVIWGNGAAHTGGQGLGDVAISMLSRSRQGVDRGRWRAVQSSMNRYLIAGYIDERVNPWEWVRDNLLTLVPGSVHLGPRGIYPAVPLHRGQVRLPRLVEGRDWWRIGGELVQYDKSSLNEVEISFALDASDASYRRSLTLTGSRAGADPSEVTTALSVAALARTEGLVVSESIEAAMVYDSATAALIVHGVMRYQGLPRRTLRVIPSSRWWHLEPGAEVILVSADLHLEQYAILTGQHHRTTFVGHTWTMVKGVIR